MTSSANSEDSYVPSRTRSSKIEVNYLKELNEDLKLRKQELLEMLKPLENKNNLLLQKLMSNLEEKQNSLQIMRQIMAGKGSDESSVMELIDEAEEMKQNLERKNKMLWKEMEMLWNKTFDTDEYRDQPKTPQIKNKADSQDAKVPQTLLSSRKIKNELDTSCELKEMKKEKQQRKMEWIMYQDPVNIHQNDFHGKVIELRIGALKNYQKANDLKLSLYLQLNSEPKQTTFNLPGTQGTMATTTIGRAATSRNDSNMKISGITDYRAQQGAKGSMFDEVGKAPFSEAPLSAETLKVEKTSLHLLWTERHCYLC
ncbi:putative coiled-coil domain-containing protein 196 isoform X2 [Talpa occidentalis]|uniref:putative coiled-coil domain-containing protein 196 isoform X2 n=1 Tax=Talpa occidentalis TaxID=50954 RepID=UPI00188F7A12|nr:putative coiled-coil domain-containing protein 196 isoform X2 [Talpa occidentalis]